MLDSMTWELKANRKMAELNIFEKYHSPKELLNLKQKWAFYFDTLQVWIVVW